MSAQQNVAIVRRLLDEFINKKQTAVLSELISPDFHGRVTGDPNPRLGHAGFLKGFNIYSGLTPDFHITIDDIFATDNEVAVRWTGKGRHTGTHEGVKPSGKSLTVTGLCMCKIKDGKITEGYWYSDLVTILHQLGPEQGLAFLGVPAVK